MDLSQKVVALYGRFVSVKREALAELIVRQDGGVARDLTRRSDFLVVGAGAAQLIDSGRLGERLQSAQDRHILVFGERGFCEALADAPRGAPPTYPLATVGAPGDAIAMLAAFDLIRTDQKHCRFGDVAVINTAMDLAGAGQSWTEIVRVLMAARDHAPQGRHKIVLSPSGAPALQWEFGLTTIEGQGHLPLDEASASIDDLFDAAAFAEAEGALDAATRLYDMSARADRTDPIAPFNLANIYLQKEEFDRAAVAYQIAIFRDPDFAEARYNLAQAYEALGKTELASRELEAVLTIDPGHADALFNLAQLELNRDRPEQAKRLYEQYLAGDPPRDWAEKARKAIAYCSARMSA